MKRYPRRSLESPSNYTHPMRSRLVAAKILNVFKVVSMIDTACGNCSYIEVGVVVVLKIVPHPYSIKATGPEAVVIAAQRGGVVKVVHVGAGGSSVGVACCPRTIFASGCRGTFVRRPCCRDGDQD